MATTIETVRPVALFGGPLQLAQIRAVATNPDKNYRRARPLIAVILRISTFVDYSDTPFQMSRPFKRKQVRIFQLPIGLFAPATRVLPHFEAKSKIFVENQEVKSGQLFALERPSPEPTPTKQFARILKI